MHDIRPYLPELFTYPGSLLYIGARVDAHSWLDELHKAEHWITIIEIWQGNIDSLISKFGPYGKTKIVAGDTRHFEDNPALSKAFDYIFWWHGPESLKTDEIKTVLATLESRTRRTIALACAWGIYPQGAHEGNPYEVHQATLYPEFFTEL